MLNAHCFISFFYLLFRLHSPFLNIEYIYINIYSFEFESVENVFLCFRCHSYRLVLRDTITCLASTQSNRRWPIYRWSSLCVTHRLPAIQIGHLGQFGHCVCVSTSTYSGENVAVHCALQCGAQNQSPRLFIKTKFKYIPNKLFI